LTDTEGDSEDGEQDFLVVGGGVAHSNTQEERDKSIDSLLDYREGTEGKRGKSETKETEDVTWSSQASPQVYYKYNPSEGKSGSSVRPLRGVQ